MKSGLLEVRALKSPINMTYRTWYYDGSKKLRMLLLGYRRL